MESMVNVTVKGGVHKVARGTTVSEFAKKFEKEYVHDIILARRDGNLCELSKTLDRDCELEFLTTADKDGNRTYIRGMFFMMICAIYKVFGKDKINKVRIEHAIGNGYYGEIDGNVVLDEEGARLVKKEMRRLVSEKVVFHKRAVPTSEAVEMFRKHKMYDKEKLFKFRRVSKTNIYNLGGFEDYFYGYMLPNMGYVKLFDVIAYNNGFVLNLPRKSAPGELKEFVPLEKLFATVMEATDWSEKLEIDTVGELNERICNGGLNEMILVQEAFMEKKIGKI